MFLNVLNQFKIKAKFKKYWSWQLEFENNLTTDKTPNLVTFYFVTDIGLHDN